jgi:hypothetical protein
MLVIDRHILVIDRHMLAHEGEGGSVMLKPLDLNLPWDQPRMPGYQTRIDQIAGASVAVQHVSIFNSLWRTKFSSLT